MLLFDFSTVKRREKKNSLDRAKLESWKPLTIITKRSIWDVAAAPAFVFSKHKIICFMFRNVFFRKSTVGEMFHGAQKDQILLYSVFQKNLTSYSLELHIPNIAFMDIVACRLHNHIWSFHFLIFLSQIFFTEKY